MNKDFYSYLKDMVDDARFDSEDLSTLTMYVPEFFRVMCDLLNEDILEKQDRIDISLALSYLVVPNDVLPEELYGTFGYMDDLFILSRTIKNMYAKYPDKIKSIWGIYSDNDFSEILDKCYFESEKAMSERNLKEKVLEFVGE